MRTTLDLPDDLMRSIKVRAAQTDRTLTDLVADLLRSGLRVSESGASSPARRVEFPLVRSAHMAPEGSLSPERITDLLIQADIDDLTI